VVLRMGFGLLPIVLCTKARQNCPFSGCPFVYYRYV